MVAVEPGLALGLVVAVVLGLAAMRASREVVEAVSDDPEDGDTDAELDWVGEADLDCEADADGDADADGEAELGGEADADAGSEGRAVLIGGSLVGLPAVADVVGVTLIDGVGTGDGVVVRLGVGVGVAVLVDGSTWQFWLALVREPACAMPDQAASAVKITEPPARKLSVVARRCVNRTDTNLSTLLVTVTAGR